MNRRISMIEGMQVAQRATHDIEIWLRNLSITRSIRNVEDDPIYRKIDVDLLWTTYKSTYQVEIKGDLWHETGNFFFETHSNQEKGTSGCFLYTQAHLLFYYFVETHQLYILPMPETREWFLLHQDTFKKRQTTTPVGNSHYTTVGCLVPIIMVLEAIPSVKIYTI